jgi:serine/threonine protein kinase
MMHLKHRNIVEMCDFYTSNNQLCIVMGYADGGDLRNEVIKARNGKTTISEELISVWLIQVLCKLASPLRVHAALRNTYMQRTNRFAKH